MAHLPSVLTDALASGETRRADGTPVALHGAVLLDDARRLYDLARTTQPDATVEVGLAQGISALAIAQGLEDNTHGVHHVIDPYQSVAWDDVGLANLRRAGLDGRVRFYEQFVEEVLPTLPPVGFAFVDGSHRFDEAMVDFVLIDKRLEVGGIIGFHDLWMNALQKLLRYILANRAYRVYEDQPLRSSPSPTRARASRLARRVPHAERIFRPEVLHLNDDLRIPRTSLVFVEKLADDDRDPDFHRDF
jgi:predicted O-methyltransferase YrrM